MNREIKFRAWDKESESMYPVLSLHWDGNKMLQPEQTILMQFTGLKDKNGKEIWEGDIIDGVGYGNIVVKIGEYDNGQDYEDHEEGVGVYFESLNGEIFGTWLFGKGSKIIGNIYENPELLK